MGGQSSKGRVALRDTPDKVGSFAGDWDELDPRSPMQGRTPLRLDREEAVPADEEQAEQPQLHKEEEEEKEEEAAAAEEKQQLQDLQENVNLLQLQGTPVNMIRTPNTKKFVVVGATYEQEDTFSPKQLFAASKPRRFLGDISNVR